MGTNNSRKKLILTTNSKLPKEISCPYCGKKIGVDSSYMDVNISFNDLFHTS